MPYYLYILASSKKETYYAGISKDPTLRLQYHNTQNKGFTVRYRPWQLVYTCEFISRIEAQKAEQKIKRWKSKKMIRMLVEEKIYIHDYL